MVAAKKSVGIFGERGWITDLSEKVDIIITRAFLINASQNEIFPNNFTPQAVYQRYGNDKYSAANQLQYGFQNLLGRYFDIVNVTVTEDPRKPTETNKYYLSLYCEITDGNDSITLGKLLAADGKKFSIVTNYLNDGKI